MSDVYQDAANVLRIMDRHHRGLRDVFYNRSEIKTLTPSVMKQSFALICKVSQTRKSLNEILVQAEVVPVNHHWSGSQHMPTEQKKTTESTDDKNITTESTDDKNIKTIGWSKKQIKRKRDVDSQIDPYICLVMVYDLLYGKGMRSGGPEAKLIKSKEIRLKELMRDPIPSVDYESTLLRYLRVNKSRISIDDALRILESSLPRIDSGIQRLSLDDILDSVIQIHDPQAVSKLVQHPLLLDGSIVIQDRASCLAAGVANIRPGMTILDVCSAPGSKTLHAIDLLSGSGCVIAVEKDHRRSNILIQRLKLSFNLDGPFYCPRCLSDPVAAVSGSPAKKRKRTEKKTKSPSNQEPQKVFLISKRKGKKQLIVVVITGDVLTLDKKSLYADNACSCNNPFLNISDIDVMFVDPSCSGSGLQANPYSVEIHYPDKDMKRIRALAAFQKKILSYSVKTFSPSVVCYSTCSIYVEENEAVIENVMNSKIDGLGANYQIEKAASFWKTKSETDYKDRYLNNKTSNHASGRHSKLSELFELCFHSNPLYDQCRGFFLAKICRRSETNESN